MTEQLLQYIWQFQYFNPGQLTTSTGENIIIINRGTLNRNQGPDFINASIKIGDTTWAGNIELHVNASQWEEHKHSGDKNYNNVILHVVWENDIELNLPFPVLELQQYVSKILLNKYNALMIAATFIPCEKNITLVKDITWLAWKERLMIERLQAKAAVINGYLKETNMHWEEVCWWMMARNFGMKVNNDAFEKIARSISVNILAKHKNQLLQLEALLLGQASLLVYAAGDKYVEMLQKEFLFLKKKYQLVDVPNAVHHLRMRPANFPAVRLAQLAMLVHNSSHLFSKMVEIEDVKELKKLLDVTANDYWHYHYVPGESSDYKEKRTGSQLIDNIIINTIAPLLFAYAKHTGEVRHKNKALQWLEQIAAEKNQIIRNFTALGISTKTALDSQALIQLKNTYCDHKRCLECAAGNAILKADSNQ